MAFLEKLNKSFNKHQFESIKKELRTDLDSGSITSQQAVDKINNKLQELSKKPAHSKIAKRVRDTKSKFLKDLLVIAKQNSPAHDDTTVSNNTKPSISVIQLMIADHLRFNQHLKQHGHLNNIHIAHKSPPIQIHPNFNTDGQLVFPPKIVYIEQKNDITPAIDFTKSIADELTFSANMNTTRRIKPEALKNLAAIGIVKPNNVSENDFIEELFKGFKVELYMRGKPMTLSPRVDKWMNALFYDGDYIPDPDIILSQPVREHYFRSIENFVQEQKNKGKDILKIQRGNIKSSAATSLPGTVRGQDIPNSFLVFNNKVYMVENEGSISREAGKKTFRRRKFHKGGVNSILKVSDKNGNPYIVRQFTGNPNDADPTKPAKTAIKSQKEIAKTGNFPGLVVGHMSRGHKHYQLQRYIPGTQIGTVLNNRINAIENSLDPNSNIDLAQQEKFAQSSTHIRFMIESFTAVNDLHLKNLIHGDIHRGNILSENIAPGVQIMQCIDVDGALQTSSQGYCEVQVGNQDELTAKQDPEWWYSFPKIAYSERSDMYNLGRTFSEDNLINPNTPEDRIQKQLTGGETPAGTLDYEVERLSNISEALSAIHRELEGKPGLKRKISDDAAYQVNESAAAVLKNLRIAINSGNKETRILAAHHARKLFSLNAHYEYIFGHDYSNKVNASLGRLRKEVYEGAQLPVLSSEARSAFQRVSEYDVSYQQLCIDKFSYKRELAQESFNQHQDTTRLNEDTLYILRDEIDCFEKMLSDQPHDLTILSHLVKQYDTLNEMGGASM